VCALVDVVVVVVRQSTTEAPNGDQCGGGGVRFFVLTYDGEPSREFALLYRAYVTLQGTCDDDYDNDDVHAVTRSTDNEEPMKIPATRAMARATPSRGRRSSDALDGPCIMPRLAIQPFVMAKARMNRIGQNSFVNRRGIRQVLVVVVVETLHDARSGAKTHRAKARRSNASPLGGVLGYTVAQCRPIKSPMLKSKKSVGDQRLPNRLCALCIALVTAGNTLNVTVNVNSTARRYFVHSPTSAVDDARARASSSSSLHGLSSMSSPPSSMSSSSFASPSKSPRVDVDVALDDDSINNF